MPTGLAGSDDTEHYGDKAVPRAFDDDDDDHDVDEDELDALTDLWEESPEDGDEPSDDDFSDVFDEDDDDEEPQDTEEPEDTEDEDDDESEEAEPRQSKAQRGYPKSPCLIMVQQGDCLLSLAYRYGLTSDIIWDASENDKLKEAREQNQLLPGDEIFIPEREHKVVESDTGKCHEFEVKELQRIKLSLKFLKDGEPRADLAYTLELGDETHEGKTDGDGLLEAKVKPSAKRGTLTLHDPDGDEVRPVNVGNLNPERHATGFQARLNHLGFPCGAVDGEPGVMTGAALAAFQLANDIEVTGQADDATLDKLKEMHGS